MSATCCTWFVAAIRARDAAVSDTGALWCAAELHRERGQLLLKGTVPDFAGAQAEFLQAMDIARRQSAKLWELRAAVNLARLWRDQDRKSDAHHLLSPIYGWFTEGFDCADLKAAKLLLEELSHEAHRCLTPITSHEESE